LAKIGKKHAQLLDKSGKSRILNISWSKKEGDRRFITVGIKHIRFWEIGSDKIWRDAEHTEATLELDYTCSIWDEQGKTYTGTTNGLIIVWDKLKMIKSKKVHESVVYCINYCGNKILTGGKDSKVNIIDSELNIVKTVRVSPFPISIDMIENKLLVGSRDGRILEINGDETTEILKSHSNGELWGMDIAGDYVVTVGDDGKILQINYKMKQLAASSIVDIENKGKAAQPHENLGGRSLTINLKNGQVAIGCNNGEIQIRENLEDAQVFVLKDPTKWIEALAYSPDGSLLAVGSHDCNIYIYEVKTPYMLRGILTGHKAFITSFDWSKEGNLLRSNSVSSEILYWNIAKMECDNDGNNTMLDIAWATMTCRVCWNTIGIYLPSIEESSIYTVSISTDERFIITGDSWGLINIFHNPSIEGSKWISLRYGCKVGGTQSLLPRQGSWMMAHIYFPQVE
jgi:WD40 repeat protein